MKQVTNKELAVKIDMLLSEVRDHRVEFKDHLKVDEATRTEVTKLVTIEEGRRWQIRTLWTGMVTALIGLLFNTLWPK